MGTDVDAVISELKALGYSPFTMEEPQEARGVIFFDYLISDGKYRGETVLLGISFRTPGYPEYPPHWIHVSPAHHDGRGGVGSQYRCKVRNGEEYEFMSLSRPPKDFWDKLPTKNKNINNYLNMHLDRFFSSLQ